MGGNGNDGASNGRWTGKKIFTTGEAATICKVSQQTIIRCFDSGRLNGFRVPGSKFRRIPREELLRFMRENNIPTDALEGSVRRVLVVDDDPEILRLFEEFLEGDDRFDVRTAETGYDAGMLTESFRPHLIILDYMLPDINGTAVCRRIRSSDHASDAKVIFVSGVIDQSEVEQLMAAGADEFVKKPFSIQQLHRRMVELLGMRQDDDAPVKP